jgi:signal transduction histidine kinase
MTIPFIIDYFKRKKFYSNVLEKYEMLDKKNLIAELISSPSFKEGEIFYEMLRKSNKAMLQEINKYKNIQNEYREYIELWVHEIKNPISSINLIGLNNQNDTINSIVEEVDKIENYIDQVLYYSRSNNVEKDYVIKSLNLDDICFDAIKSKSKDFIKNKVQIETKNLKAKVLTDRKWIKFILIQIFSNSLKYFDKKTSKLTLYSIKNKNSVVLYIEDNGIGIKDNELKRVFDKGFTGSNGRIIKNSTGMGLYLSKKLCEKLGMKISISSNYEVGTTVSIKFPISSMISEVK